MSIETKKVILDFAKKDGVFITSVPTVLLTLRFFTGMPFNRLKQARKYNSTRTLYPNSA